MADAVCGATNIEGDRCALPAGHALHQDGAGDDWGVRWGYEAALPDDVREYLENWARAYPEGDSKAQQLLNRYPPSVDKMATRVRG